MGTELHIATSQRPAAPGDLALRSFWIGGYEGADHVNTHGEPLDMARSTGHLARLQEDHAAAAAVGLRTVRESIGWRLSEPQPGHWRLARVRDIARCAQRHGLQVLWTLMHHGMPADLSLHDDALIDRYARFAAAVARVIGDLSNDPPVYTPINEIGFLAWAASQTDLIHPYRPAPDAAAGDTGASGFEIKRRLVRAALAGMDAIRHVDRRARFMHVEPLIHVVPPAAQPDLWPLADRIASWQWQVFDMLCGGLEPALGGEPAALDVVGVNHCHSGQWEAVTQRRLSWSDRDLRRRSPADLLCEAWRRYQRPMVVAQTSHFGSGRADWLHDIASNVREARERGAHVAGLCLYPVVDRHDWNDLHQWDRSGLWDVAVPGASRLYASKAALRSGRQGTRDRRPLRRVLQPQYAAAFTQWQACLPKAAPSPGQRPMAPIVVFSHLRWGFVYQRPQHIVSRLAGPDSVLFVEEPVRTPGPPRLDCFSKGPFVDVLVPHTPIDAPGFHDDQIALIEPLLADHLAERGLRDFTAWLYTPMALPLATALSPLHIVYDCMDDLTRFEGAPRQMAQRDTALMKCADLVLTGGPSLYAARRQLHPNVHCVPSAVDALHYNPDRLDPQSAEAHEAARLQQELVAGRARLGYFGAIDERMDLDLLAALADARRDGEPMWDIVMVGPVATIDAGTLPHRPNLHWLGAQPYALLPYLMASWQVCLMPFVLNEATRFISPTKTLEYMAGEKPVVSTPLRDVVALYGDTVRVANDAEGFIAACNQFLQETPKARCRRVSAMLTTVWCSSWDDAVRSIRTLLQRMHEGPKPMHGLPLSAGTPSNGPQALAGQDISL